MPKKKLRPEQYPLAIQFSEQLTRIDLWMSKAEELLAAARLLEAEVLAYWSEVKVKGDRIVSAPARKSIQGPYCMLVAYAIENYCKALLIHKNRDSFRNRLLSEIPDYIREHDLLKLVRKVGLDLAVPEEELLSRLSRNSIWAARYPVPTGPDGIRAMERFSDGRAYLTAYFAPNDVNRVHEFVDRLREHVRDELGCDV